ncbi:C-X-C motif chemokine 11-6-like [Lepisosteus oculatus]|uniref:C-X-C motif chemokine 11-6-like n=1 Tax=Lepisosteus oculatus TaxID=7918 RepID=UPI0035F50B81
MSCKVVLLVLLAVCIAASAMDVSSSQRCLCIRVRNRLAAVKDTKTIEILPPTSSCEEAEIIVHLKNGIQYCLDPNFKKLLFSLKRRRQ